MPLIFSLPFADSGNRCCCRLSGLVTRFQENQLSTKLQSTRAGTAVGDSFVRGNMQEGHLKKFKKMQHLRDGLSIFKPTSSCQILTSSLS
jgi:hypothetical protein